MPWAPNTLRQLILPAQITSSVMCQNSNVCFNLKIVFMTIKILFTYHAVYHRVIYSCIATSIQWKKYKFLHALVCVIQKGLLRRISFLFFSFSFFSFFSLLFFPFFFPSFFFFFVEQFFLSNVYSPSEIKMPQGKMSA